MRIGVPREIKDNENRVALIPEGVQALVGRGHEVLVEHSAGAGCGFDDHEFEAAGARLGRAKDVWAADLVVKVKEPLESEYGYLAGQILLAYLHLAGVDERLTHTLIESGTTAIAYETIEDDEGRLPLLAPMSAIAGSMATLMGAYYLGRPNGGRGMLLGDILGGLYGKVLVIGDGIVGEHAARVAAGLGARTVIVFGLSAERAKIIGRAVPRVDFRESTPDAIEAELPDTDLVVGAVLVKGARAPHVITEHMIRTMPEGSVVVDVSIDQGGCVETSRPTTHSDPVFVRHGVVHYCVTNMPGAYPMTSTLALTSATFPFVKRIADGGLAAVTEDPGFSRGLNVHEGRVTYGPVAEALGLGD